MASQMHVPRLEKEWGSKVLFLVNSIFPNNHDVSNIF